VLDANGEPRERLPQGAHDLAHQLDGGAHQQLELRVGLLGVREEAGQEVQHELVGERRKLGDLVGLRVGDHRHRRGDVKRLTGVGRYHRPRRIKPGICLAHRPVLIPNLEEAAVVRVAPVAAGALALLDDLADRVQGGLQVGDRDQLRPAQQFGVACARGVPTNRARSPSSPESLRSPSSIPR
jgi:hypothetical protein